MINYGQIEFIRFTYMFDQFNKERKKENDLVIVGK